jgi:hypothetical protein
LREPTSGPKGSVILIGLFGRSSIASEIMAVSSVQDPVHPVQMLPPAYFAVLLKGFGSSQFGSLSGLAAMGATSSQNRFREFASPVDDILSGPKNVSPRHAHQNASRIEMMGIHMMNSKVPGDSSPDSLVFQCNGRKAYAVTPVEE